MFDYEITHRKGSENGRADALSRRPDFFQEIPDFIAQVLQPNKQGALEQRQINLIFKVEEDDPLPTEITKHVKLWEHEQFSEGVTMESGYPTHT